MNDTISNLPIYWSPHHQQATTFVTTPTITASNPTNTKATTRFTSNNNNSQTSAVNIDPHIHLYRPDVLSKPIKKRSRSSRRTPTTLLNTSTTDFRSLVQQFTGCHNMKRSFSKGPVNLSFGATTSKSHNIIELAANSRVAPFGFGYYTNQQATNSDQFQHQQQQEVFYTKQYEGTKTSTLDDFVIEDILTNELFVDEFSINRSMQDGFYF